MRIAKLGDLHVGVRGGNGHFRAFIKRWLMEYFLPWCVDNKIDRIIQYGDFFDVRKSLYGLDKEWIEKEFIPACKEAGIPWDVLVGNHDIQLRHSNRSHHCSIFSEIAPEIFSVYDSPTEVTIDGEQHLMMPWINEQGFEGSNYDECVQALQASKAKYCHGHLELAGFQLNKAAVAEHGTIDEALFDQFEQVDTGHYHCRSERRTIRYIGTPYPLTWIDHGDQRGFEVWDTETKTNEFIESDAADWSLLTAVTYKFDEYDEAAAKSLKDPDRIKSMFGGRIVKIFVQDKSNTRHFNQFVECIRKAGCIDYQFIDETVSVVQELDVDEAALHRDTAGTMVDYIVNQESLDVDVLKLSNLAVELLGECENE